MVPLRRAQTDIKLGDPVKPSSAAHKAFTTGQRVAGTYLQELYGVPFYAVSYPVKDDQGRSVATLAFATSIQKQKEVAEMADSLKQSLENIANNTSNLVASAHHLAGSAQQLANNTEEIGSQSQEIDRVLALVKEIAQQTHLLGLNAAIEAARAGERGRGFGIVADEIHKLADQVNASIRGISASLQLIRERINSLTIQTQDVSKITHKQVAASELVNTNTRNVEATMSVLVNKVYQFHE